jgi:hypothetical protein
LRWHDEQTHKAGVDSCGLGPIVDDDPHLLAGALEAGMLRRKKDEGSRPAAKGPLLGPACRRECISARHTSSNRGWIARQITQAFPWNEAPRYLIRDQDRVYGAVVMRRFRAMGIRDKPIAAGSPWQNGLRN